MLFISSLVLFLLLLFHVLVLISLMSPASFVFIQTVKDLLWFVFHLVSVFFFLNFDLLNCVSGYYQILLLFQPTCCFVSFV